MFDSKLIQGLLIAACLFLAVGILTTALEIQRYKEIDAGPATARRTPAPTTETEEEPTAETPVETETPVEDTEDTE